MQTADEKPYSPGLEGVVAGQSAISEVNPQKQKLTYRGYDIDDLARSSTYEEVAYLLLKADLPTKQQLASFHAELISERELPGAVYDLLALLPARSDPMDALRTSVSHLATADPEVQDNSHDANLRKATRLIAKLGTIVAANQRIRTGLNPVPPSSKLSHAANLFYMITGRNPGDDEEKAFDVSLILYAEHTFNASSFAARVIASTLADMHAGVTGAIGALKGPLHGGANERAIETLLAIGEPSRAEEWIRRALREKRRVMGFGHRVYKWGDSRVPVMKEVGRQLAERSGEKRWVEIAGILEEVMEKEKGLYPNVDFPCAYVYHMLGLPKEIFTPIFAASRIAGWSAHVIEQHDDNRLIRPDSIYRGERNRVYVPLEKRG
jgi:citrate synthase